MIFLHPGLGYKEFFLIIFYLKFNKRSLSVSSRNEHEFQGSVSSTAFVLFDNHCIFIYFELYFSCTLH